MGQRQPKMEPETWRPAEQSLDGRVLAPTALSAEALVAARQLLTAKTIADVLATPFPLVAAPLTLPLTPFADYYQEFGQAILRADLRQDGTVYNSRQVVNETQPLQPAGAFREPLAQIIRFNQQVADSRPWRGQIFLYRSDLLPHGVALHTDQPEAAPGDMIALAVSANPTRVVPHKAMLDILARSPFAPVLDYRLDDPNLRLGMDSFNKQLFDDRTPGSAVRDVREQLKAALVELTASHLNIMTGMDIHTQADKVDPKRVCGKFVTNFNQYGNWPQPAGA